jgi:hypothetical protein
MKNRFSNPGFGSPLTWQAVITSAQYNGINTAITTGVSPELANAVALYTGAIGDIVGGSPCFFSPTSSGWSAILSAYNSQTSTVPSVTADPLCYGSDRQLVWKASIGNNANGSGAPAFVFERQKAAGNNPAVVQIP